MSVCTSSISSVHWLCGCRREWEMPAAFCSWPSGGGCVCTPLLALQPPVALWHICIVMILKSQVFVSEMTWSSPVHQFDTVHLSPFSHDSGLLISPSLHAAGWQRGCIATGIYVPRVLQSNTWQMADSFVERLAGCGILRGSTALLEGCRLHTSLFHFCANLEKAYLKEMCWESDQKVENLFTLSLHWHSYGG